MKKNIPSPFLMQALANKQKVNELVKLYDKNRDLVYMKYVEELLKIFQMVIERMSVFEKDVQKLRGPKGDMPSAADMINALGPVLEKFANQYFSSGIQQYIQSLIPEVKDGITPSKEDIAQIAAPIIASLIKQKETQAPKQLNALEIFTLIKGFLPAPINHEAIVKSVEDNIDIEKIVEKKGKRIKIKHVEGLDETIRSLSSKLAHGGFHGGGDTVKAGANVTITKNSDGTTTIASTGGSGGTWYQDEIVASGVTGTSFNLLHVPTAVVSLYKNGALLISGIGNDYTRSAAALTLSVSLLATDVLTATYQ